MYVRMYGLETTDRMDTAAWSAGQSVTNIRGPRVYSDSEWNVMERRGTGTMSISVLGERLDSNVR